ncbi:MAG: hypothetical protein Kow0060_13260 [Methylohalobius crimeensis]
MVASSDLTTMARYFPLWEGIFFLEPILHLHVPGQVDSESVYDFLTRQIRRRPNLLALHVCRIRIALNQDPETLFGALVDLFWMLGEKGRGLRKRMLRESRRRLPEARVSLLEQCLRGELPVRQLPFSPASVLHDGMQASQTSLIPSTEEISESVDPVAAARLCLEVGQLEQAQEILSAQLQIQPESEVVRRNLLELYRASRDTEGFWQGYRWLKDNGHLDEAWEASVPWFERKRV